PAGTVQGLVRDAADQGVPNATVVLIPDRTRRQNSLFFKRVVTNAAGQFSQSSIAPGEYQVFAFAGPIPEGAQESTEFMSTYTGKGATVRATAGSTTEVT